MLKSWCLAGVVLATSAAVGAQDAYTLREEMIPMRDGVRLHTKIIAPTGAGRPLPFMFIRTPYGIGGVSARTPEAAYGFLAKDGYIFVHQDIRGKFRSEGEFVMLRPPRADRTNPRAIDEATDAYDTVEWLLANVPGHNGRAGMTGVSYPGWLTAMAMLEPHPAMRAVSPQASPADMWIGDDFHHNGAFRLSYGFEYAVLMEAGKETKPFAFDAFDTYDWYLRLGTLANINRNILKGAIPTWNDFSRRPDYDAFWQRQAVGQYLTRVTVPTLNVAGWWDQEDFYGPLKIYRELERHDREGKNFLVVGPWNHGGWMRGEGASLGNIQFAHATGTFFRDSLMAPFFAHYLHDKPDPRLAEATTFEAGSNRWRRFATWPAVPAAGGRRLYFRENGQLSFEAPTQSGPQFDSYVSDPKKPVPYRQRPIPSTFGTPNNGWASWLTEDQRFAASRPDVLVWQTPALEQDVTIAGELEVTLHAATSGSDADWVVKLIDVYPDTGMSDARMNGYQLMVANDVFRGRYRTSYAKPAPITPNRVLPYTISLHAQNYTFRRGHRIMVQVQSSWFPLIDRNPQRFVPNIFEAKASDFVAATHRIYRSKQSPSRIVLPIIESVVP